MEEETRLERSGENSEHRVSQLDDMIVGLFFNGLNFVMNQAL
jgi:hypothetical protein